MDPTLDEEARTCAVVARGFGLISYSVKVFLGDDKAVFLGHGVKWSHIELLAPHGLQ